VTKARVTITQVDCVRETFRCGGNGGQNVNKRDTGVRFRHAPSGAVGESREQRTQLQNERAAWLKLANHPKMKLWTRLQLAAQEQGFRDLDAKVDRMMTEENLRVELGVPAKPGDVEVKEA
jgi:protein subunit release factor B